MDFIVDDNWGCVPPEELFFNVGKTPSLEELVGSISKKSADNKVRNNIDFDQSNMQPIEVISDIKRKACVTTPAQQKKPILKKKSINVERTVSLKHVSFEVA